MRRPLLILALLIAGCGQAPPALPVTPRVPAASVVGRGVISGRVVFDGPVPSPAAVRNEPCCPGAPPTLLDDKLLVGTDGGLANAFVFIENGPATTGAALPAALLDQKFCQYVPHAVGVVVDQTLTVRSSDPTMHNVNIKPANEAEQNLTMYKAGDATDTVFRRPGFAQSRCHVHPWMVAVIGVFDNPFFAVTAADGTFTIPGVPDGTYRVAVYHDQVGRLPPQTVTLAAGRPVTADFRYSKPTP